MKLAPKDDDDSLSNLALNTEELNFVFKEKQSASTQKDRLSGAARSQQQVFDQQGRLSSRRIDKESKMKRSSKAHEIHKENEGRYQGIQTRRSIKQQLYSSKKTMSKMSEEKRNELCTICIEELTSHNLSEIDGCDHKFCYDCIFVWACKSSNTCPNCKNKFNKIIKKDFQGNEIEVKISDKAAEDCSESEHILNCFQCNELIKPES